MSSESKRSAIGLLLLCLVAVTGCGYGEVSPAAYEYSKALYSLSNRRATERIDLVRAQIEEAYTAGKLPAHEAGWLTDICDDCRAARWDDAQAAARRMMQDQVRS